MQEGDKPVYKENETMMVEAEKGKLVDGETTCSSAIHRGGDDGFILGSAHTGDAMRDRRTTHPMYTQTRGNEGE